MKIVTNSEWIIDVLIFLFLGFTIGVIFTWYSQFTEFWQFRFIDVLRIVFALIIVKVAHYFVSIKIGYDAKQKDILAEILSKMHIKVEDIYRKGITYMDNPHNEIGRSIVPIHNSIESDIDLLMGIKIVKPNSIEKELQEVFISFKESLTREQFLSNMTPSYSIQMKSSFKLQYDRMIRLLMSIRLDIYTI